MGSACVQQGASKPQRESLVCELAHTTMADGDRERAEHRVQDAIDAGKRRERGGCSQRGYWSRRTCSGKAVDEEAFVVVVGEAGLGVLRADVGDVDLGDVLGSSRLRI